MVCFEDVFQPCLGVLGVPLITVPDNIVSVSSIMLSVHYNYNSANYHVFIIFEILENKYLYYFNSHFFIKLRILNEINPNAIKNKENIVVPLHKEIPSPPMHRNRHGHRWRYAYFSRVFGSTS
jgi:hypothetical protein